MNEKEYRLYSDTKRTGIPSAPPQNLGEQMAVFRGKQEYEDKVGGGWDLSYIDYSVRTKIGLVSAVVMPIMLLLYFSYAGTLDGDFISVTALGLISGFVAGWLIDFFVVAVIIGIVFALSL